MGCDRSKNSPSERRAAAKSRGAEQEELTRLLELINRARYLPADAGDEAHRALQREEHGGDIDEDEVVDRHHAESRILVRVGEFL